MKAGSGISHSERFDGPIRQSGGRVHGIQTWVPLPDDQEEIEPSFIHHGAEDLPVFGEAGVLARLIAGRAFGQIHIDPRAASAGAVKSRML
jgi:redox-sensitive bicupin YhaK (pirin superfamily)